MESEIIAPQAIDPREKASRLLRAAREGDLASVNLYIEDPELNHLNYLKREVFCIAAGHGQLTVLNRALEIPENNTVGRLGRALNAAASSGNLASVNRLLEIPRVFHRVAAYRENAPLNSAMRLGHNAVVQRLREVPCVNKVTLMLNLLQVGDSASLNSILDDAEYDHPMWESPVFAIERTLRKAAENGHLAVLNRALNILQRCNYLGSTYLALRSAAKNGHLPIVNRLLQISDRHTAAEDNSLLYLAICAGHLAVVQRLLEVPCVRDNATARNNRALLSTASRGDLLCMEELLKIPAVVENIAAENNAALRFSVVHNQVPAVRRLLQIQAVRDNATALNNDALNKTNNPEVRQLLLQLPNVAAMRRRVILKQVGLCAALIIANVASLNIILAVFGIKMGIFYNLMAVGFLSAIPATLAYLIHRRSNAVRPVLPRPESTDRNVPVRVEATNIAENNVPPAITPAFNQAGSRRLNEVSASAPTNQQESRVASETTPVRLTA